MNDFLQPEFYKFNEDSIKLIKFVSSRESVADSILDMGCGSGIIGIELSNLLNTKHLSLLDVQFDWKTYLEYNIHNFLKKNVHAQIVISSFGNWLPERKFDLIVSNPPYFLAGHGQPSRDSRRNISRTFLIDNWAIFLNKIDLSLSSKGKAFIVVKKDKKILDEIMKSHHYFQLKFYEDNKIMFLELSRLNVD